MIGSIVKYQVRVAARKNIAFVKRKSRAKLFTPMTMDTTLHISGFGFFDVRTLLDFIEHNNQKTLSRQTSTRIKPKSCLFIGLC